MARNLELAVAKHMLTKRHVGKVRDYIDGLYDEAVKASDGPLIDELFPTRASVRALAAKLNPESTPKPGPAPAATPKAKS